MFQPDGFVNDLLGTNIDFLSDPTGAQIIVILVNIWLGVPFMMMSISGALQSIPKDMYEAVNWMELLVGGVPSSYVTQLA